MLHSYECLGQWFSSKTNIKTICLALNYLKDDIILRYGASPKKDSCVIKDFFPFAEKMQHITRWSISRVIPSIKQIKDCERWKNVWNYNYVVVHDLEWWIWYLLTTWSHVMSKKTWAFNVLYNDGHYNMRVDTDIS